MALLYTAFQSVLENKEGKKLWHPRLIKLSDPMSTYELGTEVSKRGSMTAGDTLNVIETALDIIEQNLRNGRSVCLDRLGTFTITCRSTKNGVETEEEVSSDQITDLKVRFTPAYTRSKYNGTTRSMFNGVTFKKISKAKAANSEEPGSGSGGGQIDPDA